MTDLEANLAVLRERFPAVFRILPDEPEREAEVFDSRSGTPSCRLRGVVLHSTFDPAVEARRLIEGEADSSASLTILYGFGLGYFVEAFIERFPLKTVLVVEPNPRLFRLCLASRSLGAVLRHPALSLHVGPEPESLIQQLETLPLSKIAVIKPRSLLHLEPEYYRRAEGVLQSFLARKNLNINTLKRFGRLWVRNFVRNLPQLSAPGIQYLRGLFSGIPALVLASGPSLEKILPRLRELAERMLLVSVDTSLAPCCARGVKPDFAVVVDPQYWNTRHLDGIHLQQSILVSESATHPRVFRQLKLPLFLSGSFFPLGQFFEARIGEKGKIGAGGSVATSAWDLARQLGCRPICMAGLDLGFPGCATHFKDATFERRFSAISDRLAPADTLSYLYMHDAGPFAVRANDGGSVLTDQRMLIYKWWFEEQMSLCPDVETRNLSLEGVLIKGMEFQDLGELFKLPVVRNEIRRRLDKARGIHAERMPDTHSIETVLKDLVRELKALAGLASQGLEKTRCLEEQLSLGADISPLQRSLDLIDQGILKAASRGVVSFLLQPLINDIVHDGDWIAEKPKEEVLATSLRLYGEIEESAVYHLDLIQRLYEGKI